MSLGKMWRNNPIRKKFISIKQNRKIAQIKAGDNGNVIVFLVPGKNCVNGGVLSIISLAEESGKLRHIHNADVYVCTMPDDPPLYRFTKFENSMYVFDLQQIVSCQKGDCCIQVHIPEIFVVRFNSLISDLSIKHPNVTWKFNILLQNIDSIPYKSSVDKLSGHGNVTCTTAHKAYCTVETEKLMGCKVYHFSVWVSPEKYIHKKYSEKENLIVVSPDKCPMRKDTLNHLKSRMSNYKFKVIKNMTYEEYKKIIASAKFSLTFGEGLDGYLVEPVFSGGIGCAVYNDRFFTSDLKRVPFIYASWEDLRRSFPDDVQAADNADSYHALHIKQFETFAMKYSHDNYVANIENYYRAS